MHLDSLGPSHELRGEMRLAVGPVGLEATGNWGHRVAERSGKLALRRPNKMETSNPECDPTGIRPAAESVQAIGIRIVCGEVGNRLVPELIRGPKSSR